MARLSSTTGEAVRWRDRGVIGGLTIGMEACSVAEASPDLGPVLLALLLDLNRGLDESWHPSSMLVPSVSLSPKLRVTTAEIEYMPFYLRVFFRLLSSWVHTRLSCPGDAGRNGVTTKTAANAPAGSAPAQANPPSHHRQSFLPDATDALLESR
jgi:hypothetical protein